MDTELQWEGHKIQISCKPVPKYLWLATETVVKVDGLEVGRVGGFSFNEKLSGTFNHKNNSSEFILEINCKEISLVSVPYKLQIDGSLISQGRLIWNSWLLPLNIDQPTQKRLRLGSCSLINGIMAMILTFIWIGVIAFTTPGRSPKVPGTDIYIEGLAVLVIGFLSLFGIVYGIGGFFEKTEI